MDNLRLILIVCGVLVVVGIYLWETRRRGRSGQRRDTDELPFRLTDPARTDDGKGDPDPLVDEPVSEAAPEGDRDTLGGHYAVGDLDSVELSAPEELPIVGAENPRLPDDADPYANLAVGQAQQAGEELVIVLTVMATGEASFSGDAVLNALETVGMRYGEMKIFHHYGLEGQRSDRPVFSAADVLEPGELRPELLADRSTRGLILFMRLPGPLDSSVAFELMLNAAQRLAELLGGELRDETRSSLTPQSIGHIRERIGEHRRRQMLGRG